MICAGLGRHCGTGYRWQCQPQAGQEQHTQSCTLSSARPTVVSQGCCSLFSCSCRLPGCWDTLRTRLWTVLFSGAAPSLSTAALTSTLPSLALGSNTPWNSLHICYRQDLLQNHPLHIKPQERWKDMRKGHVILFLLKIKVSPWFFTRYRNLVTL